MVSTSKQEWFSEQWSNTQVNTKMGEFSHETAHAQERESTKRRTILHRIRVDSMEGPKILNEVHPACLNPQFN